MGAGMIGRDRYLLRYDWRRKADCRQPAAKRVLALVLWKWIGRSGTGWVAKRELSLDW